MKPSVLIIDDERQMRRLLRVALESADYAIHEAETGHLGLQAAALCRPDVILLDLGLPDLDGLSVLRRLREWSQIPVVVLTVRDSEQDKVAALDAGADDYVTKPFSTAELLARLRAAQRRAQPREESAVFSQEGLVVDLVARTVTRDGADVKLTGTEWSLLALLIRHAGRILTHRQILREVWGRKAKPTANTCASISPTFARRWNAIRRSRSSSSTSPGLAIAWRARSGEAARWFGALTALGGVVESAASA